MTEKMTLEGLAELVTKGFGSADTKFTALADDISGIKAEIADFKTEMLDQFEHVDNQFAAVNDRLRDISSEVTVIHRRIERLEEQGANNAGFAKEIDHLLSRVAEIEKHLGLKTSAR